ncbi:hypothetical protein F4776DRAFT_645720 [Hypoxylon sp. NC0597]|nr:hypothetical protein F4776DRAFT_645720 [Hypoxylon sp. NC0597]
MKWYPLTFLGLMATGSYARMTDGSEVFNGRRVLPLTMRGIVEPGGTEQAFNGTIQEIEAQIRSINPSFSWEDFRPSTRNPSRSPRRRSPVKVLCHVQNLPSAPREGVQDIQDWLSDPAIAVEVEVSAQSCNKFSCQKNAAIWFCNDNLQAIEEVTLTLGVGVSEILNEEKCQDPGNSNLIQGQAFDSNNYDFNVIINRDICP